MYAHRYYASLTWWSVLITDDDNGEDNVGKKIPAPSLSVNSVGVCNSSELLLLLVVVLIDAGCCICELDFSFFSFPDTELTHTLFAFGSYSFTDEDEDDGDNDTVLLIIGSSICSFDFTKEFNPVVFGWLILLLSSSSQECLRFNEFKTVSLLSLLPVKLDVVINRFVLFE